MMRGTANRVTATTLRPGLLMRTFLHGEHLEVRVSMIYNACSPHHRFAFCAAPITLMTICPSTCLLPELYHSATCALLFWKMGSCRVINGNLCQLRQVPPQEGGCDFCATNPYHEDECRCACHHPDVVIDGCWGLGNCEAGCGPPQCMCPCHFVFPWEQFFDSDENEDEDEDG